MENLFNFKKMSFTKFEIILWIFSVSVTALVFFIVPEKSLLNFTATIIGVTALILVAKGNIYGQILTILFSVIYGIISFRFRYYGEMITYLFMTAPMALLAAISWIKHPYKKSSEVAVAKLSPKKVAFIAISAIPVTAVFYFILKALGNENLIVSTVSITTSYVASSLTFFRSPYYALGYAANDIILIILWIMASIQNTSYITMVFCFIMFLLNDSYGFFNWSKMKKFQTGEIKAVQRIKAIRRPIHKIRNG